MSDKQKEREFIHALASPIAGVEMILESILDDVKAAGEDPAGYEERLTDIMTGIEKIKTILHNRRQEVLSE